MPDIDRMISHHRNDQQFNLNFVVIGQEKIIPSCKPTLSVTSVLPTVGINDRKQSMLERNRTSSSAHNNGVYLSQTSYTSVMSSREGGIGDIDHLTVPNTRTRACTLCRQ